MEYELQPLDVGLRGYAIFGMTAQRADPYIVIFRDDLSALTGT